MNVHDTAMTHDIKQYAGRAPGMIPVNFNLPQDAYELLNTLAPNKKSRSSFITQLLYEYQAQQVERLQWREKLVSILALQS